ncbi:MAG: Rnf-Nqr domain containing protein [Oscillospiraceae bacterium]
MSFFEFILFSLTVLTAENIFFTRALDIGKISDIATSPKGIVWIGVRLTIITLASSIISFVIGIFLPKTDLIVLIKPALFLAISYAIYIVLHLLKTKQDKYIPPILCTNSVVLSSMLICSKGSYSFGQTIGFALAAGIGYTFAMLLVYTGIERLRYCNPPRCFKGFPVLLVYIGLISLAVFGLLGHQLPA